ncbi:hypothetical protein ACTD5D_03890 [Nocardia takedensis]|uniref:hypothetical protein n=1 Tax=Nocardia takedensis TaxID=259390 RepID=UPI0005935470|nr:hypothetical protein [Nocardia takedensis]
MPPPTYARTEEGQLVTPEFLALIQQMLTGKPAERESNAELDPQVKALAEELSVIHLPEWHDEIGRKRAEPTVTGIKQATRVAEYLVRRGVRVLPELEEIRWMPTPDGPPAAFDLGIHIGKDAEGRWPAPDPEEFYDLEAIEVKQTDDGLWCAVHPRGLVAEGATKTAAYADLVGKLRERIEHARGAKERSAHDE